MLTISNVLSAVRIPLAFLFLNTNPFVRLVAIVLAMITDSIDGYFARKYKSVSKFGAFFDPAMDKFFVYFALIVLFLEAKIKLWQGCSMISRDFAVIIFGTYLVTTNRWSKYEVKAIRWGKITTAMQFCVLIGLTFAFNFSWYLYSLFIVLSCLALIELFTTAHYKSEA